MTDGNTFATSLSKALQRCEVKMPFNKEDIFSRVKPVEAQSIHCANKMAQRLRLQPSEDHDLNKEDSVFQITLKMY